MSPNWREEARDLIRDAATWYSHDVASEYESRVQQVLAMIQSAIDRAESFRRDAAKAQRGAEMERNARADFEARCRRLESERVR